jgi:hypothetical protein
MILVGPAIRAAVETSLRVMTNLSLSIVRNAIYRLDRRFRFGQFDIAPSAHSVKLSGRSLPSG